jgi:hypothetical protein
MNTTGYDKLVGEVTNWEDFVVEGGGVLGCCVDPANYTNKTDCSKQCKAQSLGGKCPDASTGSTKPGKCLYSVPKASLSVYRNFCCTNCCKLAFGSGTGKVCKGEASVWYGACGGQTPTYRFLVFNCRETPSPATVTNTKGIFIYRGLKCTP